MGVVARVRSALDRASLRLNASPGVGRNFVVCHHCRRVVPVWRLIRERLKPGDKVGCVCGSTVVRGAYIGDLRAAWWVLVVGLLWRRTIRRNPEWDPRVPSRL